MNCGTCTHWDTSGALGQHGYGKCKQHPNPNMRAGLNTTAENVCRIKRWEKAPVDELRAREARMGALL